MSRKNNATISHLHSPPNAVVDPPPTAPAAQVYSEHRDVDGAKVIYPEAGLGVMATSYLPSPGLPPPPPAANNPAEAEEAAGINLANPPPPVSSQGGGGGTGGGGGGYSALQREHVVQDPNQSILIN